MKNTILTLMILLLSTTNAYGTMLYDVDPNGLGGDRSGKNQLFYETELYDPDKQPNWISIVPTTEPSDNHDSADNHDPANPVPEPTTLLLLGSGLLAAGFKLKRKR